MKKISLDHRCGDQRGVAVFHGAGDPGSAGIYRSVQNAYSENGFTSPFRIITGPAVFGPEIWLAYEYSQDERLKKAGEVQVKSFLNRIDNKMK